MRAKTVHLSKTLRRVDNGRPLQVTLYKQIGSGGFGKVYLAKHADYPDGIVFKRIKLNNEGKYIRFSTYLLKRFTYREIEYLRQLNLLIGYHYDRKKQEFWLVMHQIKGTPEYFVEAAKQPQAVYASFCALRQLHRQGIAHMDPHENNFIYQSKLQRAIAIDLGMAQSYQFFRGIRDLYLFMRLRQKHAGDFGDSVRDIFTLLHDYYYRELREHIAQHQWESLQYALAYSALIACAFSTGGMLPGATLIAKHLLQTQMMSAFGDLLQTLQDHYELRAWNEKNGTCMRHYYYYLTGLLMLFQAFLLLVDITQCLSHATKIRASSLHQVSSYVDAFSLMICTQSFWQACQYWFGNLEKYVLSESLLEQYHELYLKPAHNTFTPHFNRLKRQRMPQDPIVTVHPVSRATNRKSA